MHILSGHHRQNGDVVPPVVIIKNGRRQPKRIGRIGYRQ
jgi:hypothetical protein